MNSDKVDYIIIAGSVIVYLFLALGLVVMSPSSGAATQQNVTTLCNVTNTEPETITVTMQTGITLSPEATVAATCNATVYDYNGGDDISDANGTIFLVPDHNETSTDDLNFKYTNTSCGCSDDGDGNASCDCVFVMQYFATNGTWKCNITAWDTQNLSINGSDNGSVNSLTALNVTDEIDYGNLVVTQTSGVEQADITNVGNMEINISIRGFGGTVDSVAGWDTAMICEYNNITIGNERYSTNNSGNYSAYTLLSNTRTMIPDWSIVSRTNDTVIEDDKNSTYWLLRVPLSVGGLCNGTVTFIATDS